MPDEDPTRTLALLWRAELPTVATSGTRRGPRRALDVDAVVAAALARADAAGPGGADALTMRTLAGDLEVAPMTLYTYVPGRAELVDLMVDAAYAAMPHADTAGRPWRERVSAVARENRAMHRRHPWTTRIDPGRPVLGPGETAKYEHELAAFDPLAAVLDDVDRDAALTFVLDFVRASVRAELDRDAPDDGWWAARAPVLAQVLDAERFPRAVRVGAAAGSAQNGARDPERAWSFGLARVLDGLATLAEPADR